MANPRYPQPQEPRQSSQDKKLGQLSSLLQISNASQQPQMEQQALQQRDQQQRMQALLQMMGLMQSGQEHTDQMSAHTTDAKTAADAHMTDTKATVLGGMADRGNVAANDALASMFPEFGAAQSKIHQGDLQKKVMGLLPVLSASQDKPNGPQDPTLQAAMADPELGPMLKQHMLPVARSSTPDPQPVPTVGQLVTPQAPAPDFFGPATGLQQLFKHLFQNQSFGF